MRLWLQILEGETAEEARLIFAISDNKLVREVGKLILYHLDSEGCKDEMKDIIEGRCCCWVKKDDEIEESDE